ncbi:MAG: hypothetical protein ACFE0Q_04425 [Anaerolineae bacterium]
MVTHMQRLSLLVLALLFGSITSFGLDDAGNPNNPTTNDRANACFEDGSMAGRCETELDWQAGWYLIRYEYGLITREAFPQWAVWVLPVEPEPEPVGSATVYCTVSVEALGSWPGDPGTDPGTNVVPGWDIWIYSGANGGVATDTFSDPYFVRFVTTDPGYMACAKS